MVAHGLVAICPNSATAGRALVPWRDTHAFATLGLGGARRCLQAGAGCGPKRVACVQVDPLTQDIQVLQRLLEQLMARRPRFGQLCWLFDRGQVAGPGDESCQKLSRKLRRQQGWLGGSEPIPC